MGRTRIGLKAKVYNATTPWPIVRDDVTLSMTKNEADISDRGSEWDLIRGGSKVAQVSFAINDKVDDTIKDTIRGSFLNGTALEMKILNGPSNEAGVEGLHCSMEVTEFSRNEPRNGAITYNVVMKPTDGGTPSEPAWFTVEA